MSKVTVHLYTPSGLIKSSTECAPNGYYFLRIYDEGTFIVRVEGPAGWSVTPQEAEVVITKGSNIKDDVNFWFNGFAVTGKVVSVGSSEGPAGVELALTGAQGLVTSAVSLAGGAFTLSGVAPGMYQVKALNSYIEDVARDIEVKGGNAELRKPFVMLGYDIEGQVLASDGSPMPAVTIQLLQGGAVLTTVLTDPQGHFRFPKHPPGQYTLQPSFGDDKAAFKVAPEKLDLTVSHSNVSIEEPFQVRGFAIQGLVAHPSGKGVQGATILVDGKAHTQTDATGQYTVQLPFGTYTLAAQKERLTFLALEGVAVEASLRTLPELRVATYALCGRVIPAEEHATPLEGAYTVHLEGHPTGEQRSTDAEGGFCFQVAPGSYTLSPKASGEGAAKALALSPAKYQVSVAEEPVLSVAFTQARVTVTGTVHCIESDCDPSVTVSLVAEGHGDTATETVGSNGGFTFKDITPGSYRATVNHDTWCWEKQAVTVMVSKAQAGGLEFRQSGYVLNAMLSHDIELVFTLENAKNTKPQPFSLTKGHNKFCLSQPGVYSIDPKGCYMFEQDVVKYDTSRARLLDFEVTHYKVTGTIQATQREEGLTLAVQASTPAKGSEVHKVESTPVYMASASDPSAGRHVYQYTYYAKMGQRVQFVARSPSLLFYPRSITTSITEPVCPPALEAMAGRPGRIIQGSVTPPLAGVTISVQNKSSGEVVASVESDARGQYTAGPLYDDFAAKLVASKEGYTFKHEDAGRFRAVLLSRVDIRVKEEGGEPLKGVLLSLSGESLRNHNATDERGVFSYLDIAAGEYYLRPLLKEYVFEPSALAVEVAEGTVSTYNLTAKRVAWSYFGQVSSLNGEMEKGVTVEAIGANKEHEEAKTDASGQFRLRGLKPGPYTVRVATGDRNTKVENASPHRQEIEMSETDMSGASFIVFRKSTHHDLTGVVMVSLELEAVMPPIEVTVEAKAKPGEVLHRSELGISRFFSFPELPEAVYMVKTKFKSKHHQGLYQVRAPPVEVALAGTTPPVHLAFSAELRHASDDIESSSFSLFILLAVMGLMALNPETSKWVFGVVVGQVLAGIESHQESRAVGKDGKLTSGKVKRK